MEHGYGLNECMRLLTLEENNTENYLNERNSRLGETQDEYYDHYDNAMPLRVSDHFGSESFPGEIRENIELNQDIRRKEQTDIDHQLENGFIMTSVRVKSSSVQKVDGLNTDPNNGTAKNADARDVKETPSGFTTHQRCTRPSPLLEDFLEPIVNKDLQCCCCDENNKPRGLGNSEFPKSVGLSPEKHKSDPCLLDRNINNVDDKKTVNISSCNKKYPSEQSQLKEKRQCGCKSGTKVNCHVRSRGRQNQESLSTYCRVASDSSPIFTAVLYLQRHENANAELYRVQTLLVASILRSFFYPWTSVGCIWTRDLPYLLEELSHDSTLKPRFNRIYLGDTCKGVLVLSKDSGALLNYKHLYFLKELATAAGIQIEELTVLVSRSNPSVELPARHRELIQGTAV